MPAIPTRISTRLVQEKLRIHRPPISFAKTKYGIVSDHRIQRGMKNHVP